MDPSNSDALQGENLAAIRRKNTLLIAILFSFIVSLSLILGGFIIYLVFYHGSSQHPITNPAVDGFCSVAESQRSCIATVSSSSTKPIPFTDPIHVYTHSLESAVERLSRVDSGLSDNCSTSLRAASGRIEGALAVMRVDPDNETRMFEERGGMVESIVAAMEELRSCGESRVLGIDLLLGYCRDYLLKCDLVNRRFHFRVIEFVVRPRNPVLRLVADSAALFGLQYFVILFLFILILLRCNFCYIGGCFRRVRYGR